MKALLKQLPFISGLSVAPKDSFIEAAKEMIFIWVTSMLPILFSILLHLFKTDPNAASENILWNACVKSFNPGEIIIYAITALAPVAYVMYKYNRDKIKFPDFWSFSLLLIIVIGAGSFSFAMHKVGDIKNAAIINIVAFVLYWSSNYFSVK